MTRRTRNELKGFLVHRFFGLNRAFFFRLLVSIALFMVTLMATFVTIFAAFRRGVTTR